MMAGERIVLLSPVFDTRGCVGFNSDPDRTVFPEYKRRISRRPALNGGVTFEDYGGGFSDSSANISVRYEKDLHNLIERIATVYSRILLVNRQGVFLGGIRSLSIESSMIFFEFIIKEKVSQ